VAEIIKVVADVIQSEMGLGNDRVYLYNQKWRIPPDEGLFVIVGFMGARAFGAKTEYENDPITNELVEVQSVNQQETYTIDLMSRDSSARVRKQEVILALNSTLCQQMMEQYNFKIANLPATFNDVSALEATAILNRYQLAFNTLVVYRKVKSVQFFDSFQIPPEVHTNP
jgi:hypothetical protein